MYKLIHNCSHCFHFLYTLYPHKNLFINLLSPHYQDSLKIFISYLKWYINVLQKNHSFNIAMSVQCNTMVSFVFHFSKNYTDRFGKTIHFINIVIHKCG